MLKDFIIILPPLVVILMATITKRTRWSLLLGIFSAAFIFNDFSIIETIKTVIENALNAIEFDNLKSLQTIWSCERLFILLFLLMLGIIIILLQHSGSAYAYGQFVTKKLKSKKNAKISSLILSFFLFIDDYFSCLTVGSVMQPITDEFKIPRVKLALLVSSVAVPLAIILPISSWVAYILGQLSQVGISGSESVSTIIQCDPFFLYLRTIPFLFYAIIVVVSIWFIVLKNLKFGTFAKHEKVAQDTGNLFGGKDPLVHKVQEFTPEAKNSTMWDFMLPITMLIGITVLEILRSGDSVVFGGDNGFIQVLKFANIPASLFKSSFFTLLITTIYFLFRKNIKISELRIITKEGFNLMWGSVLLLALIWTFGSILKNDLQIGNFIAQNIGYINICYLPVIFFLMSGLISILMCSAWGSMGLLIPIAIPMLLTLSNVSTIITLSQIPMILPLLGAIISGAIIGNQLSPVADVMLMAASSTGTYHMDLVKTQASLTIPSIFSGTVSFLLSGLMIEETTVFLAAIIPLTIGIIVNILILLALNFLNNKRN